MIEKLYDLYLNANQQVCTDSRNILKGSIFFALKGNNFDGNLYAEEATKKGALVSVIDNPLFQNEKTILVDDVLKTLQKLANYHRKKNFSKVLALTGTNGKTTTKELINAVLSQKLNCHSTKGNLNNHIGVPLTILSAPLDADILIIEMGANHQGEIELLCNIAEPDYGLITNIGKAHLEGFGGYEGVVKAKSEMYIYLTENKKTIFVNSGDQILMSLIKDYSSLCAYGTTDSKYNIVETFFNNGLVVKFNIMDKEVEVGTKLFGGYNAINMLTAIRIGHYFDIPATDIYSALSNYNPDNNRSQIINTSSNTLILDSYNANPSSMKAALSGFNDIKSINKILILGSMKELGNESKKEHELLVEEARSLNPTQSIFVGGEFESSTLNSNEYIFENTKELIGFIKENKPNHNLILIKGSRANKLEDLVAYL